MGSILVLINVSPALAHNAEIWGWTNCSYADLTDTGGSITVGISPTASFPGAAVHDGVLNSFPNRVADAVARWNTETRKHTAGGYTYVGTTNNAHVVIRYDNFVPGNGSVLGTTSRTLLNGLLCQVHGSTDITVVKTTTVVDHRDNWFTQDDSRRDDWEACPSNGFAPAYTCSRKTDFGSHITHELGHSQLLQDIHIVDNHRSDTVATSLAFCWSGILMATMCDLPPGYFTAGRTLDTWDMESTRRHYEENWCSVDRGAAPWNVGTDRGPRRSASC